MKNIDTYKFDGNWEFNLELEVFNQFKFNKKSISTKFTIRDYQTDEYEPSNEQLESIDYLIENQKSLCESIVNQIWIEWPELNEKYEFQGWEDFPIKSKGDLINYIRIDEVFIKPCHKDGISYVGLLGNCYWDEEHGIGFVLHRNRVVVSGGAEEADAGGRELDDNPDNARPINPEIKLYESHPKFKTFKPSHKQANIDYPHELIQRNLNQEFVKYFLSNPNPDFINPDDWQNRTYLQTACMSNNKEIFDILIPVAQNYEKAITKSHKRKNYYFIDELIKRGAGIDETQNGKNIYTEAVESYLSLVAYNLDEDKMNINHKRMVEYYSRPFVNKFSPVAIEMTTHPKERMFKAKKYVEYISKLGLKLDEEQIEKSISRFHKTPKTLEEVHKELKWVKQL